MTYSIALTPVEHDVTTLVYRAERYLASLVGDRLNLVASWVTDIAETYSAGLVGCDHQGERIVGAAALRPNVEVIDTSRRLDGRRILIVAGALAGPIGLEQAAAAFRSLGAVEVHCAWIGGWDGNIASADTSACFEGQNHPLRRPS